MPAAITLELRNRIVAWHDELNLPIHEIIKLSGCSRSSVFRILCLQNEFGQPTNVLARPVGRRCVANPADLEYILGMLKARPTLYLDELRDGLWKERELYLSIPTLYRELRRLAVTHKAVTREASERDDMLRAVWQGEMGRYRAEQFVFIDESGIDGHTSRRRGGWADLGRACVCRTAFLRGKKFSILPALGITGIIALDIFEGAVNSERFIQFLRNDLVSTILQLC